MTIVEVVVAAAILGGVGMIALRGIAATHASQLDTADSARAELLARELLDEILQQNFVRTTVMLPDESPTTRVNFTCLDDYDGWNAAKTLPPQRKDGTLIPSGLGWARRVTVINVSASDLVTASQTETGIKRITVTVSRFGKDLAEISLVRTRHWRPTPTLE
jgi:type II secretory pathway pseudopilin PulG